MCLRTLDPHDSSIKTSPRNSGLEMSPMNPEATVVIATKNRKDDLRQAVRSCLTQVGPSVEILVMDDGSTDGSSEMIRSEFPQVRLERTQVSCGYIKQRNRAARISRAPIIFSLDDDAAFSDPGIIAHTLCEFDHPSVGAVAIPFINIRQDSIPRQLAPTTDGICLSERFVGTAHALRRDVFLMLGGYREQLFHQCEEGDYSIRMLQAGYVVRLGRSQPIHHFESPKRSNQRMIVFNARNHVLYAWHNVPLPYFPFHLLLTTKNLLVFGVKRRAVPWTLEGLSKGYAAIAGGEFRARCPVSGLVYRLSRRLKKRGLLRLEQVEPMLSRTPSPQL